MIRKHLLVNFPIRFKRITLKLISSVVIEYYSISSSTLYPSLKAEVHLETLLSISLNKDSEFIEKNNPGQNYKLIYTRSNFVF